MPAPAPAVYSTVRVESRPDLGRVLVAAKDFKLGEEVIRETPLLCWPANDKSALLKLVADADEKTQNAVRQFFHPPLDFENTTVEQLRDEAKKLIDEGCNIDLDLAHTALLVAKLNAHSFSGGSHHALFEQGSRVEHSCSPNATYTSRDAAGFLVIKAIRPISKNERLSTSYIGDLWLKTHVTRRAELRETKLFTCFCTRCVQPDPLRAMPCVVDEAHTMAWTWPKVKEDDNAEAKATDIDCWMCTDDDCGYAPDDTQTGYLRLEESAVAHKLQHEAGTAFVDMTLDEPDKVYEVCKLLPPTNATAIRAQMLAAQICRTRAEDCEGTPREAVLRLRAAQRVLRAVAAMQYVAAGKVCAADCDFHAYPVVYHCAPHVLEATRDLFKAGEEVDGAQDAAKMVTKYRDVMLVMWPKMKEDAEMMDIFEQVAKWASRD